jgi:MYND finger
MGCTHSKAATQDIAVNSNAVKQATQSKTSSAPSVVQGGQPDLVASRTVSSDDHDGVAPVVDAETIAGTTQYLKKETITINEGAKKTTPTIKERLPKLNIVSDKIGNGPYDETQGMTPSEATNDAHKTAALAKKSPRRRSNSTGVSGMAAMEDEPIETRDPVYLEPAMQPVATEKVKLRVHVEVVENPQQPCDSTQEKLELAESIEPVVFGEHVGQEEGALLDAPKENNVESEVAPKDISIMEANETTTEGLKSFTPVKGVGAYPKSAKYCAGCFLEETASGAFKVCAKCKVVSYCGKSCQTQHWKLHKKVCGKVGLDISSSHLHESAFLSETVSITSPCLADESGSFIELDARSSVHEDAVRELELVLKRLRSEESLREDAMEEVEKPAPKELPDHVDAAREAILDETIADILDCRTLEEVAPELPPNLPEGDENTPVVRVPQIHTCAGCSSSEKAHGSFKSCAKCREVFYCSKGCQKSHLKRHKKTCCKTDPGRNSLLPAKHTNSLNQILASS